MTLKLGKTAALHFLSEVAISISGFIATLAIARVLGSEGVGIYALGISVFVWVNLPISGLAEALKKRISEGIDKSEYIISGTILIFLAISVTSLLMIMFRSTINDYIGGKIAFFIILVLLANVLFNSATNSLRGLKKVAHAGWTRAIERVLRASIQVVLIILGYNVAGLFVGYAASMVIGSFIAVFFINVNPKLPNAHHFRSLLSYAKYGWSSGLKGTAFSWMDTIVLGFFVSSSQIGIYEVSWSLASFLVVASRSINSTLFPQVSELSVNEEYEKIHHYLNEGLIFTGVFLIPGLFGAVAVGEGLLRVYGAEFAQGYYILILLITARIFDAYASQIVSVIRAVDKPDIALRIDMVFLGANISLNFLFVYTHGWYGAAVATLLSGIVTLGFGFYSLSTLIGRPTVPYMEIVKEIIAGGVMFTVVAFLTSILPSGYHITVLLIFCGIIVYTTVLIIASERIRQKVFILSPV